MNAVTNFRVLSSGSGCGGGEVQRGFRVLWTRMGVAAAADVTGRR
ncbi:hypothetical protein Hanom_Chr09g00811251 [Helianthus anomalus]